MENFKISIPKPCHENWDKMTENEIGRFCNQCAKSVVDFSSMKAAEIQTYFTLHKGEKICGRFKTEQLDTIIIQIPQQTLFSQTRFRKMFLLAVLIAMGTTLLSCSDENGNKQKIDKVEIVEETQELTVGKPIYSNDSTVKDPEAPKTISNPVKFPPPSKMAEKKCSVAKSQTIASEGHLTGDVEIEPITDSLSK
ncbi:hypothetical protein [Flavobacterium pedocola]